LHLKENDPLPSGTLMSPGSGGVNARISPLRMKVEGEKSTYQAI